MSIGLFLAIRLIHVHNIFANAQTKTGLWVKGDLTLIVTINRHVRLPLSQWERAW